MAASRPTRPPKIQPLLGARNMLDSNGVGTIYTNVSSSSEGPSVASISMDAERIPIDCSSGLLTVYMPVEASHTLGCHLLTNVDRVKHLQSLHRHGLLNMDGFRQGSSDYIDQGFLAATSLVSLADFPPTTTREVHRVTLEGPPELTLREMAAEVRDGGANRRVLFHFENVGNLTVKGSSRHPNGGELVIQEVENSRLIAASGYSYVSEHHFQLLMNDDDLGHVVCSGMTSLCG